MPEVKLNVIVIACLLLSPLPVAGALRLGIIGTDTSHVIAFTQILNDDSSPDHVPGGQVVAAYKGGSPDIESSAKRVDQFAEELRDKWKVRFYVTIPELCQHVDAILLESVDGRIAPGAGACGDCGAQAVVHRQAAGRDARGRARDRPPGSTGRSAMVQLVEPALRRDRARR